MKSELEAQSVGQSEAEAAEPEPRSNEAATAAQHEFEAEEQRFFSEPPEPYEEAAEPSFEHGLGVTERAAPSVRVVSRTAAEKERDAGLAERADVPLLSARQRQLRRRVAGSMGAMLAFLLLGFVVRTRIEAAERARDAVKPAAPAMIAKAAVVPAPPPSIAAPELRAVEIPAPPAASVSSDPVAEEDTAALIRSARSLLSAGHTRDGVVAAREAVQKNPLDAEPYILLAAGLQDLGAWHEAREVFSDCLRKAKRGTSSACQYFARR
jgi:hypothetical protein